MKHLKNFNDFLNEGGLRTPEAIKAEYKDLKKASIQWLRSEWSRMHRVGDPREMNKDALVMDILIAYHGSSYVEKAFENQQYTDDQNEDFVKMQADKLGMSREEYIVHFGNPTPEGY